MKKITRLGAALVLVFCIIFALCSFYGFQNAPKEEPSTTSLRNSEVVVYTSDILMHEEKTPTQPVQISASTKTATSRHRDDIVSDGNLLNYELQDVMQDCGEKYEVPYALLLAIAETESRFNPDAVSGTNDYGLMQINQCNHAWLLELGMNPKTHSGNIESGAYIISQHLQKYNEPELALMAYNCGPTGAKKLWDAGIYQTDYSKKVMNAFERWEGILKNQTNN